MKKQLYITIVGNHLSGKTSVGIAICDFLRSKGLEVTLADPDVDDDKRVDPLQDMRMEALKGMEVSITAARNWPTPVCEVDNSKAENLDAMTERDLTAFIARTGPRKLTTQYARQKRQAMRLRLAGNTQEALSKEKKCDELYRRIPAKERW